MELRISAYALTCSIITRLLAERARESASLRHGTVSHLCYTKGPCSH